MSAKPAPQKAKTNGKQNKISLPVRESPRSKRSEDKKAVSPATPNAFARMMGKYRRASVKVETPKKGAVVTPVRRGSKRKNQAAVAEPESKSARSSRGSTPASARGRTRKSRTYKEADSEDDDDLSDAEF